MSQGLLWKLEGLALRNQELTWRAPKDDKKYYGIYFLSRNKREDKYANEHKE